MSEQWSGAEMEARRVLGIGLADVIPDDAAAIRRKNELDPAQRKAVNAVAALVRRYDRKGDQ